TIGDVFKKIYGKQIEFLSTIFMVPVFFGYVAAQLVALSLLFGIVTGMSLAEGILLSAGIVVIYTFLGGMWAISITDFIQTIMIVLGLITVAILVTKDAGGVKVILDSANEESFQFFPDSGFDSWINYFGAWIIIGLGSIPSQDIYQRVMS